VRSIFDILHDKIDIITETSTIVQLFTDKNNVEIVDLLSSFYSTNNYNQSFETFIDKYLFPKWKYRGTCVGVDQFKHRNKIDFNNIYNRACTMEDCIVCTEYIYNLMMLINEFSCSETFNYDKDTYNMIFSNIEQVLSYCNMYIKETGINQYRIYEKDAAVSAVAIIIQDKELAFSILEYNHISNKGKVKQKQIILKQIANDFEVERVALVKSGFKELESDLGFLFNNLNIRHNNKAGKYLKERVKSMKPKEVERWYDYTYRCYLLSKLAIEWKYKKDDFEEIKKQINMNLH